MEVRMYGLTTHDVRSLAYQLAERNGIANHPFSLENKIAGRDWLFGFQKRHPGLSLRVPEATSVARAKAFNKPVVSKFFDLLKAEYQKHNYPAHRIYNVDETSLSTVPGRNSKTFAKKRSQASWPCYFRRTWTIINCSDMYVSWWHVSSTNDYF
jgi:hypothetical protein